MGMNEVSGIDWNLEGYKKDAHFFLCGAFECFPFVRDFLTRVQDCPWMLKNNAYIDSVFGSPTCIWNGGRTLANVYYNKQQLRSIHDTYVNLGINIRFIFTNPLLNEHDLFDRYSNMVISTFEDLSPEVVINSSLLEGYLRNRYPSLSFISSTTKRLRTGKEQLNEFRHDYKYVCLDYDYNHNDTFLASIQEQDRKRVEILVNSICPKLCKVRTLHQDFSARRQLEYDMDDECNESEPFFSECPFRKRTLNTEPSKQGYTRDFLSGTNYIFPQDLDKYLDMGFNHFKIQGRELPASLLFAEFFPYLIKPEFYPMAISLINK